MPDDKLTIDEVEKMAADIGLTRLTAEHLQQLMVATRQARSRRDALPVGGLVPADEPSHVFRLDPKEGR